MDEDAPNIVVALIINGIIFVIIPLIMAYRRGYFINFGERLRSEEHTSELQSQR